MSRTTVDDILDRINQLPEEDRRLLDELLAQQEDQEWSEEAANARKTAESQGLDQEAMLDAVWGSLAEPEDRFLTATSRSILERVEW